VVRLRARAFHPARDSADLGPDAIADEVRRVAKMGCHAITFPENPVPLGLPSLHSDHWDPFWKACNDLGTVVCMHIGSSGKLAITAPDAPIDVLINLQPMNIVQAAADVLFSPMIRKFPDVTIALSEGGIGWIPYFLERIDHTYKVHKAWTFADFGGKLPSEVFMERMILCFIEDDFGARQAREIGTDRICIETDYPHSDAVWPNAPERMMEAFAPTDLTDDEINEITHLNAMKFFQYDPFSIRPREKCTGRRAAGGGGRHDISIVAKGRRIDTTHPRRSPSSARERPRSQEPQVLDRDADAYQAHTATNSHTDRSPGAPTGIPKPTFRYSALSTRRTCSSSAVGARNGSAGARSTGSPCGRSRPLSLAADARAPRRAPTLPLVARRRAAPVRRRVVRRRVLRPRRDELLRPDAPCPRSPA
jgi:predicted TIM-barrel fold metal-dependent hydrolase